MEKNHWLKWGPLLFSNTLPLAPFAWPIDRSLCLAHQHLAPNSNWPQQESMAPTSIGWAPKRERERGNVSIAHSLDVKIRCSIIFAAQLQFVCVRSSLRDLLSISKYNKMASAQQNTNGRHTWWWVSGVSLEVVVVLESAYTASKVLDGYHWTA